MRARTIRAGLMMAAFLAVSPSAQASTQDPAEALVAASKKEWTLPLRVRAALVDRILAHRLDTLIPQIMREEGIDMWLLMSREYFEDPVTASMLDAKSMSARRRTILIFHDPGNGEPIERLTVSR